MMHLVSQISGHDIQMAYYSDIDYSYTSFKYMYDDMRLIRS